MPFSAVAKLRWHVVYSSSPEDEPYWLWHHLTAPVFVFVTVTRPDNCWIDYYYVWFRFMVTRGWTLATFLGDFLKFWSLKVCTVSDISQRLYFVDDLYFDYRHPSFPFLICGDLTLPRATQTGNFCSALISKLTLKGLDIKALLKRSDVSL